jgi:hypothetical protein
VKVRTWHMEAAAQASLYLGAIYAQHATLARPELLLAAVLWLLGRVASRNDRQREVWQLAGVVALQQRHEVECAQGAALELRLVTLGFGAWGLLIGSWLTLADVVWGVAYALWRRWYRNRYPA